MVSYKPSSNGLVERANKSIISILRTLITPTTPDWHLVLDDVQLTLNNSVNESVGDSPHYILYGYDGRMPHTLLDDAVPPRPTYNYEDYVAYRTRRSYDIVRRVRELLSKSTQSRKFRYDKGTVEPSARLGQKVFVRKHVKDGPLFKVSPKYDGPYRIVELLKFNKYRLRNVESGDERITHWNHLKLLPEADVSFMRKGGSVDCGINDVPVSSQENVENVVHNLRSRAVVAHGGPATT